MSSKLDNMNSIAVRTAVPTGDYTGQSELVVTDCARYVRPLPPVSVPAEIRLDLADLRKAIKANYGLCNQEEVGV